MVLRRVAVSYERGTPGRETARGNPQNPRRADVHPGTKQIIVSKDKSNELIIVKTNKQIIVKTHKLNEQYHIQSANTCVKKHTN